MQQIKSMAWCMTPEAYRGMLRALEADLSEDDYPLFHHAKKFELENIISNAGERVDALDYTFVSGNVGTILMDGPIVPRASSFGKVSGILSVNGLMRDFKALESNPSIEHIVLLHDSPGGSTTGTSEFANLVANSSTHTVSFAYGMSASADYWIGAAADEFFAVDTAIIGSIGTLIAFDSEQDDEIVITSDQSPNKNADPATEEGAKQYQEIVNSLTDIFATAVAKYRNVTIEKVFADFGKGGVMVASKALDVGMIDGITTYESLLQSLKQPKQTTILTPAANAGKGFNSMNEFEQFLAENPAAKAHYEAQLQAQYDAGFKARQKELTEVSAVADPVLAEGSKYGNKIKAIALRAYKGECSLETLEVTMEALEAIVEGNAINQTQAESEEVGNTTNPKPERASNGVDSIDAADKLAADIVARRNGTEVK
jgi:ClpP class serine protease